MSTTARKRNPNSGIHFPKNPSIALVYRLGTAAATTLAGTLSTWLKEHHCKVFTAPEQKLIAGTRALKTSADLKKMDLVVVLGGDGTYLRAVRLLAGQPVPILGVNMGSLGFLTPTRADEVFAAVDHTLKNKMELVPRTMLELEYTKGRQRQTLVALNDIVIERGRFSQLITVGVHCGGEFVSEIKADGLIISSPTGSTAYNLAAGGPILHPSVDAMVVTPIAAHALTTRPLIMPQNKELVFRIIGKPLPMRPRRQVSMAQVVVDGQLSFEIGVDQELTVRCSSTQHLMVQDPQRNFFFLLRDKLKFGDRS